jgi:hypothetical protein
MQRQAELPQSEPGRGRKTVRLKLSLDGKTEFDQDIKCRM